MKMRKRRNNRPYLIYEQRRASERASSRLHIRILEDLLWISADAEREEKMKNFLKVRFEEVNKAFRLSALRFAELVAKIVADTKPNIKSLQGFLGKRHGR